MGFFDIFKKQKENKSLKEKENILDLHFKYNELIKEYYKKRNEEPEALKKAINYCKKQIDIADKAMESFKKEYKERMKRTYEFESNKTTFEEYLRKEKKKHPFDPPSHRGFKQLAIIKYKQERYKEVIELCKKAKKQGWNGDWDKRIERARKKL
jgi:hypothetical protein